MGAAHPKPPGEVVHNWRPRLGWKQSCLKGRFLALLALATIDEGPFCARSCRSSGLLLSANAISRLALELPLQEYKIETMVAYKIVGPIADIIEVGVLVCLGP
jgi:hypothetical protein